MKTKNKALLAGPFLVWTVAFIAIPLLMVIYYGFTGDDGSFTLENVKRILAPALSQIPVAGPAPLSGKHRGLSCHVLSSGHDFKQH